MLVSWSTGRVAMRGFVFGDLALGLLSTGK